MKKLICVLFCLPFIVKAQDASFVNITDSATGVHYDSLYVVVTDVSISSPAPAVPYTVGDSTINPVWSFQFTIKAYRNKSYCINKMQPIFVKNSGVLFLNRFPVVGDVTDKIYSITTK